MDSFEKLASLELQAELLADEMEEDILKMAAGSKTSAPTSGKLNPGSARRMGTGEVQPYTPLKRNTPMPGQKGLSIPTYKSGLKWGK